ncbi:MAG: S41 family peptidase [Planctomycetes bacterium]|nr:S41 family peptidase [Planctomycetota bacterium]
MRKYLISLSFLIAALFCFVGCQQPSTELSDAESQAPFVVEAKETELAVTDLVEAACDLIYQGQFDDAATLIEQSGFEQQLRLNQLMKVIEQYQAIRLRRQLARETAYTEKMTELEELQVVADANGLDDVNDITKILSTVAKAVDIADEFQKDRLLSDPFVKLTIAQAKAKSKEFESDGKWLDAYVTSYSWLHVIDQENEEYSDYAEKLLKKASIVASFQDSPCETSKQRYKGVEKKMFIRAINALNFNYVSIIDYRQMTTEALERCKLLADAMKNSNLEIDYEIQDTQYKVWLAALVEIIHEVYNSPTGITKDEFIDIFNRVIALNSITVDLPETILITQFAEAALGSLDQYTVMVWPRHVEDFERAMTNEFTGIGIEISKSQGLLTVSSLLPDTPAYRSGLDAGDVIEQVDDLPTKDMSLACAVKNITGPKGTDVTLTVKREGEEQRHKITITRARITVPTIRGWQRTEAGKWKYMIDEANKIGYVRITSFAEQTSNDLESALDQLETEGMKGLILDLRFNTGGLLTIAIEVADKFLEKGLIVRTQPRFGLPTWASARKRGTHPNYPLVVLINSSSASASEIVSGALADPKHNRAILVGERSYGKSAVLGITSYPEGGAQLKYTMAYYHLPSGKRVESQEAMKKQGRTDWGVGPNIEVKLGNTGLLISDELRAMIDTQRDNSILVRADHDNDIKPLKKHTAEETFLSDSQMAIGILGIKSKLIQSGINVN